MRKKRREKVVEGVLRAIEASPAGIARLDVLASLRLASRGTLLATLCRLGNEGRVARLKRGTYSAMPIRDGYACAQAKFGGYIAFASALKLHGLITEEPFTIAVATPSLSRIARIGNLEIRAVALGEKAQGAIEMGGRLVSSRAKTLFDCLLVPRYGVETPKLEGAYAAAGLSKAEWAEFESYVSRFGGKKAMKMREFAKKVRKDGTP
jgi:predicted transcriptional regulator of viral defense system